MKKDCLEEIFWTMKNLCVIKQKKLMRLIKGTNLSRFDLHKQYETALDLYST